jgi:haloalkane dehalogenase
MDFLDTPAERFADLPDYPFEAHFVEVDDCGLRMHCVDEGPRDGAPVLMLHGEPSWSYLYRSMIPVVSAAGLRVIAPDLIGFGRSSKPTRIEDYSYARHVAWLRALIEALDLEQITLFGQDWGALTGLRLLAEMEPRFSAAMIGNGALPTGTPANGRFKVLGNAAAFLAWRTFAKYSPWFVASSIVNRGSARELSDAERAAYDAPFPDARYLAGARAFPALVPISSKNVAVPDNRSAWQKLENFHKPFVTAFSTGDPITRGMDRALQKRIPGARGQDHSRVRGGHFLQEDAGAELAARLAELARSSNA